MGTREEVEAVAAAKEEMEEVAVEAPPGVAEAVAVAVETETAVAVEGVDEEAAADTSI